jgi:hypothetical protein
VISCLEISDRAKYVAWNDLDDTHDTSDLDEMHDLDDLHGERPTQAAKIASDSRRDVIFNNVGSPTHAIIMKNRTNRRHDPILDPNNVTVSSTGNRDLQVTKGL